MKKVLLMIMCAVLAISSVACSTQNNNVTGSVGGITTTPENTDITENQTPTQPDEEWVLVIDRINSYAYDKFIYDDNGRITEKLTFNTRVSETEPTTVTTYTYTKQSDGGVLVQAVSDVANDEVFYGLELFYNAEGVCVASKKYNVCTKIENVFTEKYLNHSATYEYDGNLNLIKIEKSDSSHMNFSYDEKGNMVSYEKWEKGACFKSVVFTFNDKDDIVKETVKDSDGERVIEYTNPYDYEGGRLFRKAIKDERGSNIGQTTYTYNESGAIIKIEIVAGHDGFVPAKYFIGEGYYINSVCFPMTGNTVTFMPLSQALSEQSK